MLTGAFSLSLVLHVALLAWLQPGERPERLHPEFPLSVRLLQPAPAARESPPVLPQPPRRAARTAPAPRPLAPRPPLPEPALALQPEQPEQPLRLRVVADPATYGATAVSPEQRYAWPGEVDISPFPPEGISILYPAAALRNEDKGLVVVRIDVDRSGGIERQHFLCSSPAFEESVRAALAAVRFRPAFVRDARVSSWILLEFAFLAGFALDKDPASADQAFAALQSRCLQERQTSAQPAR